MPGQERAWTGGEASFLVRDRIAQRGRHPETVISEHIGRLAIARSSGPGAILLGVPVGNDVAGLQRS